MAEYIIDGREYMEGFVGDPIRVIRELVRCKDCKYGEESIIPFREIWCRRLEKHSDCDWFCADGVKKT